MRDMPRFSGYDASPVYTMKTVVQQTGITPTTLRAWERRYGILQPDRTDGGYRLYSEQDIALLRWLKSQIEAGINIGRAVALLDLKGSGKAEGAGPLLPASPAAAPAAPAARFRASAEPEVPTLYPDTHHTGAITQELLHALMAFCETKAGTILSEAFALHSYEVVTEAHHRARAARGRRALAARFGDRGAGQLCDHFPTPEDQLHAGRLQPAELRAAGDRGLGAGRVARYRDPARRAGPAPAGWRVLYMGQNVPASQLVGELPRLKPELVCLSATMAESATRLLQAVNNIRRLPEPRPRLLIGGRAMNLYPELRDQLPEAYLGATASAAIEALSRPAD